MPIKTEPVPVHTEEGAGVSEQVDAEKKEEEPKDTSDKQIPKAQPKRVSKKAKIETPPEPVEEAAPHPKSKAKAKGSAKRADTSAQRAAGGGKAKETADLSQKTKCPICKRVVTTHCLLYTHKCPKAALDEKKKIPTVEEEVVPPPPKLERAQNTPRDMKQWVEEHPGEAYPHETELPVPEVFAPPPTFVDTEGGGYLTIAERRVNHREALEQQYREYQFHKKQNQISHLRQFYR